MERPIARGHGNVDSEDEEDPYSQDEFVQIPINATNDKITNDPNHVTI